MTTLMTDAVALSMDMPAAQGPVVTHPGAGAAFAAQLGQALGRLGEGQSLAAGVPGLQATALSPGLQVLTPVDAVTDPQALADFAKSQGIDESAVQWLFQRETAITPHVASPSALATALAGDGAAVGTPGGEVLLAPSPVGQGLAEVEAAQAVGMTPAALMLQRNPFADSGQKVVTPAPGANTLAAEQTPATAGQPLLSDALASPAPEGEGAEAAVDADANTGAEAALPGLAALAVWTNERWGSAAQRSARAEAPVAPSDPAYGLPQVNKVMRPELAVMVQKMVAAQDAGQRKAATHVDVLELDPELQADLRNWLDDGVLEPVTAETRPSAHAQASAALSPQATMVKTDVAPQAMVPASNAAERAENLQALAQRVGQAVGQRLVSMIERGHWNVKFMLKPQQLGEIEVDLRMRSGELDAAFRASNAFTRELLQDGLPRLREVMSNMGMDVASMHVGNGQTQQHGGKPTSQPPASKGLVAASAGSAEAPVSAPVRAQRVGQDGLDVLV